VIEPPNAWIDRLPAKLRERDLRVARLPAGDLRLWGWSSLVVVHVRPASVPGPNARSRSLGDPQHDCVWAVLAEAGVPAAPPRRQRLQPALCASGGPEVYEPFFNDALSKVLVSDRAIHDAMASLIMHGVFLRHPRLKVASWRTKRHPPLSKIRSTPSAHIWLTPYCEEDLGALAELIGVEHVLFGSDWPHGEGLADPQSFMIELDGFDEHAVTRVMRENARELLGL
jgi:hypothetical protein